MNIPTYNQNLKKYSKKNWKSMTKAEILLWGCLKKSRILGLYFSRQKIVGDYIVDFYCRRLKLAIEVDDNSHDFKTEKDYLRSVYIREQGIKIFRVRNSDVYTNLQGVLDGIKIFVLENYEPFPLPPPKRGIKIKEIVKNSPLGRRCPEDREGSRKYKL